MVAVASLRVLEWLVNPENAVRFQRLELATETPGGALLWPADPTLGTVLKFLDVAIWALFGLFSMAFLTHFIYVLRLPTLLAGFFERERASREPAVVLATLLKPAWHARLARINKHCVALFLVTFLKSAVTWGVFRNTSFAIIMFILGSLYVALMTWSAVVYPRVPAWEAQACAVSSLTLAYVYNAGAGAGSGQFSFTRVFTGAEAEWEVVAVLLPQEAFHAFFVGAAAGDATSRSPVYRPFRLNLQSAHLYQFPVGGRDRVGLVASDPLAQGALEELRETLTRLPLDEGAVDAKRAKRLTRFFAREVGQCLAEAWALPGVPGAEAKESGGTAQGGQEKQGEEMAGNGTTTNAEVGK